MRTLSKVFLVLVLAVAACRTVPRDVADAHQLAMSEGETAFVIAEDMLDKIEAKSSELNDETVNVAFTEWKLRFQEVSNWRFFITEYLREQPEDIQVTKAYRVGTQLMNDMNGGMTSISQYWAQMMDPAKAIPAAKFIELFRKDIARYRELERKFDDWITQFRVKG